MPHQFRTHDGRVCKASAEPIFLQLADGTLISGIWGGSAQHKKLEWWLKKDGYRVAQTVDEVAAIAVKDEDTDKIHWGDAPADARLLFVVPPEILGKDGRPYRIVQLVTRAAEADEMAYFNDTRSALFANLQSDGRITILKPLPAPPPEPPIQGELF